MRGKIIKSQKELYFVKNDDKTYLAKARGNFRVKGIKPLVGDEVIFEMQNEENAYITEILPRKNEIKRPNISNIDQILLFVTINNPPLNLFNLDKYLAMCEYKNIEVVIIISKIDLDKENKAQNLAKTYENIGYKVLAIDNYNDLPKESIKNILQNKTSAVTGSSGVGKSTFLSNLMDKDIEIGEISEKSKRGKNTTRHTEIFAIDDKTFIFDTPGFDSFDFDFITDENDLKNFFVEMRNKACKFNNCNHINEPSCKVKEELKDGKISESRYKNYILLFNDIKKRRENRW
ncbi:ribosome small subunit-dependent GTPase A [Anaerococcus sp. Marseille-P3625]|uniref:ribosome small subunit-dependent GTPase A n=1 Tax=Anaerococcus sp. Marseille-P3625 TaxID=1977277 RepID=UPI000C07F75B|nr:ribosome small subunit-dependent GTPase A [Anaerococcus sp. Marseille-P3625]